MIIKKIINEIKKNLLSPEYKQIKLQSIRLKKIIVSSFFLKLIVIFSIIKI